MRVVLDTNVLARASFSLTGPAAELLERLKTPAHMLLASVLMLDELRRVLRYPRLTALHGLDDSAIIRYVADIEAVSLLVDVRIHDVVGVAQDDPDDDAIIATAVSGDANVLCTLDWHLRGPEVRDYCAALGIRILTDVELLVELRGSNEYATHPQ